MRLDLADHVAVITGGASGIGLACARAFMHEGAFVALLDIAPDVAQVAMRLAAECDGRAIGLEADVSKFPAVQRAIESSEMLGPLDHLVHCAAIGSGRYGNPFLNLKPADWLRPIEVNLMGTVNVAHAVAPRLVERPGSTMVFIGSVAGQTGSQTDPPYSATKAATINFAQCMAKDLARYGVRVNTVCPGAVQTALNRSVWHAWYEQQPVEMRVSYEEWSSARMLATVPLGRWQTVDDVANMALFLSSPQAANVTGQTINVDGGYVMHS